MAQRTDRNVSRWSVALLGVSGGIVMADPNIASTALVEASRGLHMPPDLVPVAASIENYTTAATVVSAGLLADRVGRRRLLMTALALVIASELLTAAAPSPGVYLAGRAITGVATGAIFGAAFAFIRAVVPTGRVSSALGTFGATAAVAMMAMTLAGGAAALTQWRTAFLVVPAVAAVVLVLVPRLLPVVPRVGSGPVDATGQVLLAVGVVAPLYALSRTSDPGPAVWIPAAVGALALAGFVLVEHRGSHPFFPLAILTERVFLAAILIGLAWPAAQAVLVLQLANVWQYLDDWSTFQVSVATMPAFAAGIVASILAGRLLSGGMSHRTVATVGSALTAVGFAALAFFHLGTGYALFLVALVLIGAGTQAMNVPYGSLIVSEAPPDRYGPVTSSRTTFGQIGYALGIAGTSVLIDRLTVGGMTQRLQDAGASPARIGEAIDTITMLVVGDAPATSARAREILATATASYASAFAITMAVVALAVAALALGTWLLLRHATPRVEDSSDRRN